MSEKLTIDEAGHRLAEFVDRVAEGETFTLVRDGIPVAELRPVRAGVPLSELPALLASLPRLSKEEADEFARDLEEARAELSRRPVEDRWAS